MVKLYKPFKNTTKSNFKFFVYVKADNKRGYRLVLEIKDMKILHNIKIKFVKHHTLKEQKVLKINKDN